VKRNILLILSFPFLLLLLCVIFSLGFTDVYAKAEVDNPEVSGLMKKASMLQIPFIENQGQIKDESVRFYANTFAGAVFVTDKGEIVYRLIKTEPRAQATRHKIQGSGLRQNNAKLKTPDSELHTLNSALKAVALKETLECPEELKIKGMNKSITKVNYFKGIEENWRTNIPTWQEISLGEIYKGIELKLRAYGKNVEKIFTVYPQGSVNDIKLKLEGAKGLKVNKDGELEVETELGIVRMTKPVAYQEINGNIVEVVANYILLNSKLLAHNDSAEPPGLRSGQRLAEISTLAYGFEVEAYDSTKPLIIDPLLVSTFIGGSADDYVNAITIDSSGNVFVAGGTFSSDYPTTSGTYDTTHNADQDVFVSKLDSNLSGLLSSTFIGGSADDYVNAITIDSSGNVFVAGDTGSTDYPTTSGAYDTTYNGGVEDAFVSKLDSSLSSLLSSTFIGGSADDYVNAITIDSSGNVFVAGDTFSSDYPTTTGAYDTTYAAVDDVFVSKLDSNLSSLLSSTFIGGFV